MDMLRAAGHRVPSSRWALCLFLWGARTYLPRKHVLEPAVIKIKPFWEVVAGGISTWVDGKGIVKFPILGPNPKHYNPRHARRK